MTKREIVKRVVGVVVQAGTGIVVNGIIRNNVPTTHPVVKVAVGVASFAIGGVVAGAAQSYSDATIDEIFDGIQRFQEAD